MTEDRIAGAFEIALSLRQGDARTERAGGKMKYRGGGGGAH